MHAVVARSTYPNQNSQNTRGSDHLSKLRCRKSAHGCGEKHMSKSTCVQHCSSWALFETEMLQKCVPLWRETISKPKCAKHLTFGPPLDVHMSFCAAGAKGSCTFPTACAKIMASVGHLKGIWRDACCRASGVQETCSSEMLGSQGEDSFRWVAFWSIRS